MKEISTHRRERSSENLPVLDWADRVFNELMPSRVFRELMPSVLKEHGGLMPAFDISEADDHFIVKADLPGIDAKSLDIGLSGNVLTISGERKEEREEKTGRYYSLERQFGSFSRSFLLPADVKEEGIEANYKDGVLTVTFPKTERARQKKIQVKPN
jgi:HSP20 family protein